MPKERRLPIKYTGYRSFIRPAARIFLSLSLGLMVQMLVFLLARAFKVGILEAFYLSVLLACAAGSIPLLFWGPKLLRTATLGIILLASTAILSPILILVSLPILALIVIVRRVTDGKNAVFTEPVAEIAKETNADSMDR